MFNLFKRKDEKKSYARITSLRCLEDSFDQDFSLEKYIRYYFENSPVFTATKLISDACSSINIVVKDKTTDEFISNHESLNLINQPNPFKNGSLAIKELVSFYLLTGNSYINITKSFKDKPLEWDVINPRNITIEANLRDGYPELYTSTSNSTNYIYKRDRNKFICNQDWELAHLRDFNPMYSSGNLLGSSAFAGCALEISQYILASVHNNALLKNQARPSGLLTYKGQDFLSDEQVLDVKEIMKDELSGAANAGRTSFLNGEFDWVQLSQNVKDMDFPSLKKSTAQACYTALKIPLPMVSPDNMSFSNMDASKYAFYDNAVLPVFKDILAFLTQNILSKYKGAENYIYSFDESSIESLANRKIDSAIKAGSTGVLSKDEIRTIMGYEGLKSGGDIVYQPMNLVPVGSDNYTQDNRTKPAEKAIFIKTMKDGGYSETQINEALNKFYDNPKSS